MRGIQARRFKWVSVGYCRTFDELIRKLTTCGDIPEGQWREAVKVMFEPDDEHPRGIADSSWVDPDSYADFPYVDANGDSNFAWTGIDFRGDWRWLVGVRK